MPSTIRDSGPNGYHGDLLGPAVTRPALVASPFGRNILTANQASVETDTSGFIAAGCNIDRVQTGVAHGSWALRLTPVGSTNDSYVELSGIDLTTGTWTVIASRADSGAAIGGSVTESRRIVITDASGSPYAMSQQATVGASNPVRVEFSLGSAQIGFRVRLYHGSSHPSDLAYWDRIGVFKGSVQIADWVMPGEPFGNAHHFDGVDRDENTQGWEISPLARVTGPFTLEARVKVTAASSGIRVIAGKWSTVASGPNASRNVLLYVDSAGRFAGSIYNAAGGQVVVTSVATVVANRNYAVALTWDGTTLRLFVDGDVASVAPAANIVTPDATTPFTIGRGITANSATTEPHPFGGVIDDVRLSSVARYTAGYTPATTPLTSDGSTIGLWSMDEMSGRLVALPRYTVTAPGTGLVRDLTSTSPGVSENAASRIDYPAAGLTVNGLFRPYATVAPNSGQITVSPKGEGWRDNPAIYAAEDVIIEEGIWEGAVVAHRGSEVGALDQEANFYCALYAVSSTGVARSASATGLDRSLIGLLAVFSVTIATARREWSMRSVAPGTATTAPLEAIRLKAGDRIQAEWWMVPTTAGSAKAPNAATSFYLRTNATTGSRITSIPIYSLAYARPQAVTGVGTVPFSRRLTGSRAVQVTGERSVSFVRRLTGQRSLAVTGAGTVTATRGQTSFRVASVTGAGAVAFVRRLTGKRSGSVGGAGTTAFTRRLAGVRLLSVTGTGTTSQIVRAIISRQLSVTGNSLARLRLELPQAALNRMTGSGGTTVIKKVVSYIFDD